MAKYLVIMESASKAAKVAKFLGKDYEGIPSVGHVIDLPSSKLSVNIKKDFQPTYEIMPDKKDVVKNILKKAKKAEVVYLMTDPDREGEYISFHISNQLDTNTIYKRASTQEITKKGYEKAIKNAHEINQELVNAAETRRILDRLVGYKCSFLVKQSTGGSSAGRTQSAGLRILADRENEIKNFIPIVYWPIEAELLTSNKEKIVADIKKPKPLDISTKKEAEKIMAAFKKGPVKVSKYDVKEVKANAYPPFETSSLQQSASSFLGFSPSRTMKAAQVLYSSGATTYHRTDSLHIVPEIINEIRNHIDINFDAKYLPKKPNCFKTKAKNAQEAHEAIRPTDITVTKWLANGDDAAKLYEMIWKRTIASQMMPARYERRSAEFSCKKYVLSANGSKQLFDGFRKIWNYTSSTDTYLPDLSIGDLVDVIDIKTEKKETQPPNRFTEASFIKELKKSGIGRPSTYASIPDTLSKRKYITVSGKKKSITTTELGLKVCEFLVKSNFCFIDLNFTASMEDTLDDISNGKVNKVQALTNFWNRLKQDIDKAKKVKKEESKTDYDCPLCKEGKLVKKHSKWGAFYGCSQYKEGCKYTAQVGKHGEPIEKEKSKKEYGDKPCPLCESKMVKRKSKYGVFFGCEKYPSCHGMRDVSGEEIKSKKKKYKKYKKKYKKK